MKIHCLRWAGQCAWLIFGVMPSPTRNLWALLLFSLLLAGAGLRFVGLTRGSADLVLAGQPDGNTTAFYHFHPDEETVVQAALNPDVDLLNPPFTVYGLLPVYTLRGALALADLCSWGGTSLEDPDAARRIYYVARTLAALCSCGVLFLVWRMGCRYFDRPAAALALAIVSFAPGAIQQAHFFIVDGFFVLLSTAAVYAALHAIEHRDRRWYALSGILIGATASVRLNGLLLGLVLLAGHLTDDGRAEHWRQRVGRQLREPGLWLAGGCALALLLLVEPFLIMNPAILSKADGIDDFGLAVKIARGELLQPWTLVDLHTIPYLDHWRLWSLIVGWPLSLIFVLSAFIILWHDRQRPVVLMALWCALYFLLIGQFQVKTVRYLMPMLPFMALFAGALLAASWQAARPWVRQGGKLVTALVVGHLAFKGIAFARIYTEEDSRLLAGRWIASQIPRGSHIGIETGGFSMQRLVSCQGCQQEILDVSRIFYAYPYFSCRAQLEFLETHLQNMEYLALTDVNRHAQFTAVPELFPVLAGLYKHLVAGELGFDLVQHFKIYPSLLGLSLADDGVEPSFLGYDHPTVWIFRSRGKAAIAEAFAHWEKQLAENPCCPDPALEQVAEDLRAGDWVSAKFATHSLLATYPDFALGYWLLAQIHRQLGAPDSAAGALARYRLPDWVSAPAAIAADSVDAVLSRYRSENPRVAHVIHLGTLHYIPATSTLSLLNLGLGDMAFQVLKETAAQRGGYSTQVAQRVAFSYLNIANLFSDRGGPDRMEQVVELSIQIFGTKEAFNILANRAQQRGEPERALKWWEQSLLIDADQADIHRRAGLVALLDLGQADKARYHFGRAIQLDSAMEARITAELKVARENR